MCTAHDRYVVQHQPDNSCMTYFDMSTVSSATTAARATRRQEKIHTNATEVGSPSAETNITIALSITGNYHTAFIVCRQVIRSRYLYCQIIFYVTLEKSSILHPFSCHWCIVKVRLLLLSGYCCYQLLSVVIRLFLSFLGSFNFVGLYTHFAIVSTLNNLINYHYNQLLG